MDPAALNLTTKALGFGRFLFIELDSARADRSLFDSLSEIGRGMENAQFADGHPDEQSLQRGRFQYLRREVGRLRRGEIEDDDVTRASVAIRREGNTLEPLLAYERRVGAVVGERGGCVQVREGVRKDRSYTSYAMNQFSYARALAPAQGAVHPLAVFLPQSKTHEWWAMDWMRRESHFLPRYAEDGTVIAEGHTVASADGIPYLVRRLYHNPAGYGLDSEYDFLGYFEFAEEHADVFDRVMKRLRNRQQNPEWNYVREGPEWWARRVGTPDELWI